MSPRLKLALKLLPLLLIAGAVGYLRLWSPVAVRTHQVARGDVPREVFGRGTVESRRETQLGFDLSGRISDVLVDEGDRVHLGQVLAHLAPEQYEAELRTASSGAQLARAALGRLEMSDRGFGWTVEMQARAARLGLRCVEVPVRCRRRQAGESKIAGTVKGSVQAGAKILWVIGREALHR